MRGTVLTVNKSLSRPLLIGGIEKRWVVLNSLLAFLLIAVTHFRMPDCFFGVIFFMMMHFVFRIISKHDPFLGQIIKRSTRFYFQSFYPAKSHPLNLTTKPVKTLMKV